MSETTFPMASASLPVRLVIYLPSSTELADMEADDIEAAVVRVLCERFGGVTAYPARGTFALASGVAQTEAVNVLETYCEREAWQRNQAGVARMARLLASLLRQESIGCSVNGKMILIQANEGEDRAAEGGDSRDVYSSLREAFT